MMAAAESSSRRSGRRPRAPPLPAGPLGWARPAIAGTCSPLPAPAAARDDNEMRARQRGGGAGPRSGHAHLRARGRG